MSINVTVHGNPISIKRGKMVTHERESEFERRRRIRLQQVRQQSKEIAADVRDRVRKEKGKQLSKLDQKTEEDLERWKARKLAQLEKQLNESTKLKGSAQANAQEEPDPETVLREINEKNQEEAQERGRIASELKKFIENESLRESQKALELKKKVRQVEDARASMVTKLNKESLKKHKKKKKKPKTNITIEVSDTDESDRENKTATPSPKKHKKKKHSLELNLSPVFQDIESPTDRSPSSADSVDIPDAKKAKRKIKPWQNYKYTKPTAPSHRHKSSTSPVSSSVSETIEHKEKQLKNVIYSDVTLDSEKTERRTSNDPKLKKKKVKLPSKEMPKKLQMESHEVVQIPGELPFVPTTTLEPNIPRSPSKMVKVSYLDMRTKFSTTYDTDPLVQKVSKLNLVRDGEDTEEREFKARDSQYETRDARAYLRGKQAMEKAKIQKDYQELMAELPVLQRQERLSQMKKHDPKFHMPESRAIELEKRRQEKIENIFQKYYNKSKILETPLITIRPVQKSPPGEEMKLPFRALDITESPTDLNVGTWQYPCFEPPPCPAFGQPCPNLVQPGPSVVQPCPAFGQPCPTLVQPGPSVVQPCPRIIPENIDTQEKLKDLLRRVNRQRDLLLQEVSTLHPCLQKELVSEGTSPPADSGTTTSGKTPKKGKKSKKTVSVATSPKKPIVKSKRAAPSSPSSSSTEAKPKKKTGKASKKKKAKKKEGETQTSPARSPVEPKSPTEPRVKVAMKIITDKSKEKDVPCPHCPPLFICSCPAENLSGRTDIPKTEQKCSHCPSYLICSCPLELRSGKQEDCTCGFQAEMDGKKAKHKEMQDESNQVCEIVIKTKDEAHVQVSKENDDSPHKRVILNVTKKPGSHKPKIRLETPSKTTDNTSSTVFARLPVHTQKSSEKTICMDPHTYKYLLHSKPQQTNVVDKDVQTKSITPPPEEKYICPNLLKYIKKLLSMSRQSIDELTVTSISDVSTPGNSVVETSTNVTPLIQLQNVIQRYNLSLSDIQKHLSPCTSTNEGSTKQATKMRVDFTSSSHTSPEESKPTSSETDYKKIKTTVRSKTPTRDKTPPRQQKAPEHESRAPRRSPESSRTSSICASPKTHEDVAKMVEQTFGIKHEDMDEIPNILSRYKDLTKTCCERISKLTKMIDSVRAEKERILSPASDKYETTATTYMDLPQFSYNSTRSGSKNSSVNSSMSQGELDRYLLAVDRPGSPKKSESPSRISQQTQSPLRRSPVESPPKRSPAVQSPTKKSSGEQSVRVESPPLKICYPDPNKKIIPPCPCPETHPISCTCSCCKPAPPTNSVPCQTNLYETPVSHKTDVLYTNQTFVPMLQGIPKFHETDNTTTYTKPPTKFVCTKSRPPLSFKNNRLNLDLTPHELSTIAELDTVLSSKTVSEIPCCPCPESSRATTPTEKTESEITGVPCPESSRATTPTKIQEKKVKKSPKKTPPKDKSSKPSSPSKKDGKEKKKEVKEKKKEVKEKKKERKRSPSPVEKKRSSPKSSPTKHKSRSPKTSPKEKTRKLELTDVMPIKPTLRMPRKLDYCQRCCGVCCKNHTEVISLQSTSSQGISGVTPLTDKSSSSSPDDMGIVLQRMGMSWAVSTLKKTHEQYALCTSSSSSETSFRRCVSFKETNRSSPSDVSLKNILSRELEKKYSSTLISETSIRNFQDQQEVILCSCDYLEVGRDASNQRTSTPVQQSKSTDSKKDLFSGDSELSSVRYGDEYLFLSIPNMSLDTNKSLSKSKE